LPAPNVNAIPGNFYTVQNSENLWDDKFTATTGSSVAVTLPQAGSINVAPFIASRFASGISACTTCSTTAFAEAAGDALIVGIAWLNSSNSVVSVGPDLAGNVYTRLAPDQQTGAGLFNNNLSVWVAKNIAANGGTNTVPITMSGSQNIEAKVVEYNFAAYDKATSAQGNSVSATIPVSFTNEVALDVTANWNAPSCSSSFVNRGTVAGSTGLTVCEKLLSAVPSVSDGTSPGANGTPALMALADFGITGVPVFASGWEFYVENQTTPCIPVIVTPTISVINTATQSGLTTFTVPCGMTARFRSDGTNYEMFQLTGSNKSILTTAYTNATTGFTNTGLAFFLNAGQSVSGSCKLPFKGTATTAAPILQFTGPASPTTVTASLNETLTAGSSPTFYSNSTTGSTFAIGLGNTAIVTTAADMPLTLEFGIVNGSTAGTVNLQAKSNGAGTITFEAGASCSVN
jgi:hypothetical protein